MSRFPHLPETFILREMDELERQGWQIALYPLILQQEAVIHSEAMDWLSRLYHLPYMSRAILSANSSYLRSKAAAYWTSAARMILENMQSPGILIRSIALLPKAVAMAQQMQAQGIKHIHAHYATHPAFVAWVIHRLTGITYSVTVHAHDIFVRKAMLATKLRQASFIVAISKFNRDYLKQTLGAWTESKTHIVHCGIVPDLYLRRDKSPQNGRAFELINVGSLQPYKGHPYLIEACSILRDRGVPVRCRIIGGGEGYNRLEKMIKQLGLEQHVQLLGPRPQDKVAQLLSEADCYVQPSIITPSGKMEGIPVALMEAMACELPVVATAISGIPELVQPSRTGYLVPPANSTRLAGALLDIYTQPGKAAQLAAEGRKLVLEEFDLANNVSRLGSLFQRYIGITPIHDFHSSLAIGQGQLH
jgi:glycosyltransferase involved in cell wall biosynthesis